MVGREEHFNKRRISYPTLDWQEAGSLRNKSLLIAITFTTYILLAQCPNILFTTSTISSERTAGNIALIIDYGNSTQQVFTGLSGLTAFDVLNNSASIVYLEHGFGRFVTAINGVVNNANANGRYWQFWVNDELSPIATDFYELADGDRILWKYCSPENAFTGSPFNNSSLWIGLLLITCFVGLVIGIAFFVNRKLR